MSGLAAVLRGDVAAGTYRWESALEVDDVARAVGTAHWAFGHLDGWQASTKAEVLAALGESLDFADHYGRNLDAFADCLADLDQDRVLLWDGWSTLARAEGATFATILGIIAAQRDSAAQPRLVVLLRGPGPETADIPLLE
ncbi:barstar family protein [Nocardioides sp. Bht2]|uniref:barstar family protein n=1 Tax=Nocardioides sp. Bht2 TaxID=3392297 RepID=UPI0039B62D6E